MREIRSGTPSPAPRRPFLHTTRPAAPGAQPHRARGRAKAAPALPLPRQPLSLSLRAQARSAGAAQCACAFCLVSMRTGARPAVVMETASLGASAAAMSSEPRSGLPFLPGCSFRDPMVSAAPGQPSSREPSASVPQAPSIRGTPSPCLVLQSCCRGPVRPLHSPAAPGSFQ